MVSEQKELSVMGCWISVMHNTIKMVLFRSLDRLWRVDLQIDRVQFGISHYGVSESPLIVLWVSSWAQDSGIRSC